MSSNTQIFFDWQFWSAIAALIAIALSQVPPIRLWFKKGKIKCDAYARMHITHTVGNPNVQWHLLIENIGGRTIRINNINLNFHRIGGKPFSIHAQNFFRTSDAKESLMFTPFRLSPGEEWNHVLAFYELFSREDEKEYRRIQSSIRNDIYSKVNPSIEKDGYHEALEENVIPANNFFNKFFIWEAGEYELELEIETDSQEANLKRNFIFTLFESESKELREYSYSYKFGAGIYWISDEHRGINVPINPK